MSAESDGHGYLRDSVERLCAELARGGYLLAEALAQDSIPMDSIEKIGTPEDKLFKGKQKKFAKKVNKWIKNANKKIEYLEEKIKNMEKSLSNIADFFGIPKEEEENKIEENRVKVEEEKKKTIMETLFPGSKGSKSKNK